MNTTIQVRIDSKMKQKADKTFKDLGLDISSAIKVFLHQAVASKSIPFKVESLTENGFTHAQEMRIIKETEDALKYGKRYDSLEKAHKDILGHA